MSHRTLSALFASAVLVTTATRVSAASPFDPQLKFRVLRTEHFRIYFHQGEDRLAARLSAVAEEAWRNLERPLGVRPPRLTHVVLADQTEQANGFATALPYDTIVIFATWPRSAEFEADDWLRLVFTHEFTHIIHLDRSEHWARVVRNIFGRTPIAFPNIFLPAWQIEGLATYEESARTGEGRLHAGDFRAVVDEAARQRSLEPLDRVNGGLTDWPSGNAPYAYGARFHQFLVERYGEVKLAELTKASARRFPYTQPPVFQKVFGRSLGDLWRDFEASLITAVDVPALDAGITRLTHDGFVAAGPRFDRGGSILYSRRTPHDFPTLERLDAAGTSKAVATRYFGATVGIGADAIYFDQLDFERNVALLGDLYRLDRASGRVTRLTSNARLRDPDLSPDGRTIVAVKEGLGQRDLVLIDVARGASPSTLLAGEDTQFNTPRWSPDGRLIAVERHRLGYDPEIVVVDVRARTPRVLAAAAQTRIVMPAWRPDGRGIVAAVAEGERVFNLYEFPLDGAPARQLTHTTSGTLWPDISADGRTIAFAGYTTAGYDVFTMPYPDVTDATRPLPAPSAIDNSSKAPAAALEELGYKPLASLGPTTWEPVFAWGDDQVRLGAATFGRDVLGYHSYFVSATWLVSSPTGAPTPNAATPDWTASYSYNRWRPTLFAAASTETSFFTTVTETGTAAGATRRERLVQGGLLLPFVRARHAHSAFLAVTRSEDDYTLSDRVSSRDKTAIRAAWRSANARIYGYSISPERGILAGATSEFVRKSLGSTDDATVLTGDFRAFLPGLGRHHVLAARAAGGRSAGDRLSGRTFELGGPGPDLSVTDFGSGAISLLRGFEPDSFFGSRVAVLNVDYRWPLARLQRGSGSWPFFLHTAHAAVFADAGHAWTRAFDVSDIKTAVGAELSFNLIVGFFFPLTATTGVAWGHDGSHTNGGGAIGYFRVGRAF